MSIGEGVGVRVTISLLETQAYLQKSTVGVHLGLMGFGRCLSRDGFSIDTPLKRKIFRHGGGTGAETGFTDVPRRARWRTEMALAYN